MLQCHLVVWVWCFTFYLLKRRLLDGFYWMSGFSPHSRGGRGTEKVIMVRRRGWVWGWRCDLPCMLWVAKAQPSTCQPLRACLPPLQDHMIGPTALKDLSRSVSACDFEMKTPVHLRKAWRREECMKQVIKIFLKNWNDWLFTCLKSHWCVTRVCHMTALLCYFKM